MSVPSNPSDLRLALDACRANSDELALPELAALAERLPRDPALAGDLARSHAFDRRVRQALDDVSVPAGLTERMLAAVEAHAPAAAESPAPLAPSTPRPKRFRWQWLAIATAAAVLLAVGLVASRPAGPGSVEQLSLESSALLRAASDSDWQTDVEAAARAFPYEPWLRKPPTRYRQAKVARDAAVVYDLLPDEPGSAVFVVVRTQRSYALPALFPDKPQSASGDVAITAWRPTNSPVVYVLAVEPRYSKLSFVKGPKVAGNAASTRHSLASR